MVQIIAKTVVMIQKFALVFTDRNINSDVH